MPSKYEMEVIEVFERLESGKSIEVALNNIGKRKYKIALPLSDDFRFFLLDEKGEGLPVSSIALRDTTRFTINVPEPVRQCKLKVIKQKNDSNTDSTGSTTSAGEDESGDRFGKSAVDFVDWLEKKNKKGNVDKETGEFFNVVHNARREIIIQRVGEETTTG